MALTIIRTSSPKKKKKLTAKERELEASWKKIKEIANKYPPFSGKFGKPKEKPVKDAEPVRVWLPPTSVREHSEVNLVILKARMNGVATLKTSMKYTGDKMLGVATMHKSNMVPVFSEEESKDISKMRR